MPIVKLRSNINVFLLGVCLLVGTIQQAAAEPMDAVSLFVNQCLDFTSKFTPDFTSATAMERKTIGLQNLSDRLQYYRAFKLSDDDKQWLLQCQLSIAETMNKLFNAPQMDEFISRLAADSAPQVRALSQRYRAFKREQLSDKNKMRLTTAQTAIKQRLNSNSFQLDFGDCQLTSQNDELPLSIQIAKYLLHQPNENCRRMVWQAYQTRAVDYVKSDLAELTNIQNNLAKQLGYQHFTDLAFNNTLLHDVSTAKAFLNAIKQPIAATPWNIGQQLKQAPKSSFKVMSRSAYISLLQRVLPSLDVKLEFVADDWIRLWHHGRLLGDFMLVSGPNRAMLMRYSVIGKQPGIARLSLKDTFSHIRDLQSANSAVAEIVAMMAGGGKFYLLNDVHEYQDTNELAAYWLTEYLNQQTHASLKSGSREALFHQYGEQFERLKSIAALAFYTGDKSIDLANEFQRIFGEPWPNATELPFTFDEIGTLGPLYLVHLFQQKLANAVLMETSSCNQAKVFNALVVNEDQENADDFAARLWPKHGIMQFISHLSAVEYTPTNTTQCRFN